MRRCFVTGASSMLGRAVIDGLGSHHEIVALHHRGDVTPGVAQVSGDIVRSDDYTEALRSCDTVVHLAAVTHAADASGYHRVNEAGTAALVEACDREQHVVFASSRAAVVGGGAYAASKLAGERIVTSRFPSASILRLGEVVSPGTNEGITSLLHTAAQRRLLVDVRSTPPVTFAPITLGAAAHAVGAAAESRYAGTATVSAVDDVSVVDLQASFRRAGCRVIRVPIPIGLLRVASPLLAPRFFVVDQIERLAVPKSSADPAVLATLGVEPPDIDEIVASFVSGRLWTRRSPHDRP